FVWMDFMAALVSVPLVTYLGFVFAPQLENLLRLLRRVEVAVLLLVLLLGVVVYWYRRSRNRQAA
ncbi:MAG: DedA family protein, partial [Nitrospinota bacterium]